MSWHLGVVWVWSHQRGVVSGLVWWFRGEGEVVRVSESASKVSGLRRGKEEGRRADACTKLAYYIIITSYIIIS